MSGRQAGQGQSQSNGMALASLICGILAVPTLGLTSLPGLIMGIIGLSRAGHGRARGQGQAIVGIVLSSAALLLAVLVGGMALMLYPALRTARARARQAACMSNLRQAGLAAAMFAMDNNNRLPEDLADVCDQGYTTMAVLQCPADEAPMTTPKGATSSYRYVGALDGTAPSDVVIAYDKTGNHRDGRSALFKDGHVEFIPEADLAGRLSKSLESLKAAGWDQYSEEQKERIEAFHTPD